MPCEDRILLGTTEQEYCGDPASVAAEPEDITYLLEIANQFLRPEMLRGERVLATFAGLRVLPPNQVSPIFQAGNKKLTV